LPDAHILNDKHISAQSFDIVLYPTLIRANLELYFLFLDRELGSVRCYESSFCDWVNHDYFIQIKIHVISESPTAIHIYSERNWQAVSTKAVPCFQLLFECACRQIQFSGGCSWVASYCQSTVSIIVIVYWGSFMSDIFLRLLISVLLHPPNGSNFHGSSFWLFVIEGRTL
jgi:hypothetical protein